MLESRIYVGLHDRTTHEQIYETDSYKRVLKEVCKVYQTPFSLMVMEGGYYHDDGTWVDENTLMVTLIGAPRKTVYNIARNLCTLFHQETVMITTGNVININVRERYDVDDLLSDDS